MRTEEREAMTGGDWVCAHAMRSLTREEEQRLVLQVSLRGDAEVGGFRDWRSAAWQRLYDAHKPCVERLAVALIPEATANRATWRVELVEAGHVELYVRSFKYDPVDPRGARFWTYAHRAVRGAMIMQLASFLDLDSTERVKYPRVWGAERQLRAEGRTPTPEEISARTGLDLDLVGRCLDAWYATLPFSSLDRQGNEEDSPELHIADHATLDAAEASLDGDGMSDRIAALDRAEAGTAKSKRQCYLVLDAVLREGFTYGEFIADLTNPRAGRLASAWMDIRAKNLLAAHTPADWATICDIFTERFPRLTAQALRRFIHLRRRIDPWAIAQEKHGDA